MGALLIEHKLILIIEDLFTILACKRCSLGASSLNDLRRHLPYVSVPAPDSSLAVRKLVAFPFRGVITIPLVIHHRYFIIELILTIIACDF